MKDNKLKSIKENKLIAEFMGHEFTLMPDTDGKCYTEKDSWDVVHEDDFWVDRGCFAYNTSWDWLMPVVEKCYDNGADENEVGDITHALLDCDIDHTYRAVVEFINQLNR